MLTPLQFQQRADVRFADNEFQHITEQSFRDFAADIAQAFVAQAAVNVPDYEPGRNYTPGFVIRHSFGGPAVFLTAGAPGFLPPPTDPVADLNWLPSLSPAAGPALSQVGTVIALRRASGSWVPGRLYVLIGRVDAGGQALPDVYVQAVSAEQLEPEGYLLASSPPAAAPGRVSYDLSTDQAEPVRPSYSRQETDTQRAADQAAWQQADATLQVQLTTTATGLATTTAALTKEVADRVSADASLATALRDGVPAAADTLQKLYNLLQLRAIQYSVATQASRNALSVRVGDWVNVDDDGDGRWAIYRATSAGVNASYVKISDPDLLNAAMTALQIKQAYESNTDTNAFTNALLAKLVGIAAGATANSPDAQLRDRATHTGTQAIATVTGLQSALDGLAGLDKFLGDWNAATNTPALVAGVGVKGTYYRIGAAPPVYTQISCADDVNTKALDVFEVEGLAAGQALWGEGVPAGTSIVSVDAANYLANVNNAVTLTTPTRLYAQAPVAGVRQLVVGNFVYFDGTQWMQRGSYVAATRTSAGALSVGPEFEARNGVLRALVPSLATEVNVTAVGQVYVGQDAGSLDRAPLAYAITANVGTRAVRLTTGNDPYTAYLLKGKLIAVRSELDSQGLTLVGSTFTVNGASYTGTYNIALNANESVIVRVNGLNSFSIVADTRRFGVQQLKATQPDLSMAGRIVSLTASSPVTIALHSTSNSLYGAPVGSVFTLAQDGPGQLVITYDATVTVHFAAGAGPKSAGQYGPNLVARVLAPNEWVITGGIA